MLLKSQCENDIILIQSLNFTNPYQKDLLRGVYKKEDSSFINPFHPVSLFSTHRTIFIYGANLDIICVFYTKMRHHNFAKANI